jgi:hypothetical protein
MLTVSNLQRLLSGYELRHVLFAPTHLLPHSHKDGGVTAATFPYVVIPVIQLEEHAHFPEAVIATLDSKAATARLV